MKKMNRSLYIGQTLLPLGLKDYTLTKYDRSNKALQLVKRASTFRTHTNVTLAVLETDLAAIRILKTPTGSTKP